LTLSHYDFETDKLEQLPLTHYPPLLSVMYALILSCGFAPSSTPTIMSLIGWPALLVGIGILTYQLGRSTLVAALAITLASITYGFWWVYQFAISETLFLPLLVWLMVVLVDLPEQQEHKIHRLLAATVILSLLILTRYSGSFIFLAIIIWWWWTHLVRRDFRWLAGGTAMLSFAPLPFVFWMAYNMVQTDKPVSSHLSAQGTFLEGIVGVIQVLKQVLLPASGFYRVQEVFGWAGLHSSLLSLAIIITGIVLYWWYHLKPSGSLVRQLLRPQRTPILIILFIYTVVLYIFMQPFLNFEPIDLRDITTTLCLLSPWAFGAVANLPRKWGSFLAGGFVAINCMMACGPIVVEGVPNWVHLYPPAFESLADNEMPDSFLDDAPGMLSWVVTRRFRLREIENHHVELQNWLDTQPSDTIVVSNTPLLFLPYAPSAIEEMRLWEKNSVCVSQHHVVLVVFEWDHQREKSAEIKHSLEEQCPELPTRTFANSTVYELKPANP
jgi:hypothetical protein